MAELVPLGLVSSEKRTCSLVPLESLMPTPTACFAVLLVFRRHASTFVYYPAMLSAGGLVVDILTVSGHPARHSRHVRERFTAPDDDPAFQAAIAERLEHGAYRTVLFIDEAARRLAYALPVDARRDALLPIPRANPLASAVDDKLLFHAWCEQHELPVARTHPVSDAASATRLARAYGYPVVLKGAAGTGGDAVRICPDEAALLDALVSLAQARAGHVMLQEYIRGPVGSVIFVARRGRVAVWSAFEKQLALARGLGPSVVCRPRTDAELGRLAVRAAAAGEVSGVTGFDWMEPAPGRFVVIDPHFGRCTPPAVIAPFSGVNLGAGLRRRHEDDGGMGEPADVDARIALFPQIIELVFQGRGGELLRAAPPFSKGVRYYFGPAEEWWLSVRIGLHYLHSGLRVLAGRLRRAWPSAAT